MVNWFLQKVLGTHSAREVKRLWPIVEQINRLEPEIQPLSDEALRAKTDEFRVRLRTHKLKGELAGSWAYSVNHSYRGPPPIPHR